MPTHQAVVPNAPHALYEMHGYSPAIRSGDLLFVSGQVGCDTEGNPIQDIEQQIDAAFKNLGSVLKAAGCGFEDVIDVTSFHVDPESHMGLVLPIKDRYFDFTLRPNWTAVGVTWLSGFQFEIKVVARIPGQR